MTRKLAVLVSALLAVGIAGQPALAHDTDIYVNQNSASGSEPLVMLILDLRANTTSEFCGTNSTECDFLYDHVPDDPEAPETIGVQGDPLNGGQPYLTERPTSQMNVLRAVIKYVLNRVSGVKVGLMLNHDNNCTGNPKAGPTKTGCSNGAYVFYGFNSLANKSTLFSKLDAIPEPQGNSAHAFQGRELYFELFRYLTGQDVYNGRLGYKDFGNTTAADNLPADWPDLAWDASVMETSGSWYRYRSPLANATACTKVFAINFLFAVANLEADSDDAIDDPIAGGGLGTDPENVYSYSPDNSFSPIVRWMYEKDLADGTYNAAVNKDGKQNVTSFFVTSANITNTLQNYASAGQGVSGTGLNPLQFSDDPRTLITALTNIFQQILSVSTTFTSPSVAVNVYNRSQVLSDVYIAMFVADEDATPLWAGNLKKFKISDGKLKDANGVDAVAGDGRILHSALSYWTDSATLPPPNLDLQEVNGKDGRSVARGGCGQRIPGFVSGSPGLENEGDDTTLTTARNLFTEPSNHVNGTATTLMPLNADEDTATALYSPPTTNYFGAATTTIGTFGGDGLCNLDPADPNSTDPLSACNLLKWARGLQDNGTTKRDWMMADPLHSKPLAINYGNTNSHTATNPDVRIVMGTNDGYLRMIRNVTGSGTEEGIEAWAFMPREVMDRLGALKLNASTTPHVITVDGAPSGAMLDADLDGNIESGDKVYVFFGLRRGGKSYYGLDISDPDVPKILWKITQGDPGFAELGQTWSTPRVARMLVDGTNVPVPVVIFGGGYDVDKDTHPPHLDSRAVGSNDTEGNALFIVNATTGALIWKTVKGTAANTGTYDATAKAFYHDSLLDSVPADVTPVDTDGNGLVDRIYFADTGGVVWRIDTKCSDPDGSNLDDNDVPTPGCGTSAEPNPWRVQPILSVGRHYSPDSSTLAEDRRFFYAPDYVQARDETGPFDAIILGSGDREDPLNTPAVNYFYMFKDRDTATGQYTNNTGTPVTHAQLGDITDCTPATPCTTSPPDVSKGWRLKMECPSTEPPYRTTCGEKVLATADTIGGAIFFTSYVPPSGSNTCELAEGTGALYAVNLQDGAPVGFAASSSALDKADRFTDLKSGGIPAEIVQLGGGQYLRPDLITGSRELPSGVKTYWRKKQTN